MAFPLVAARSFETNPLRTRLLAATALCAFAALPLAAQPTATQQTLVAATSSSSHRDLFAGEDIDGTSPGSAPAPAPAPAPSPQYGGSHGGYGGYHESKLSHVAVEVGGGFTAPVGNDVNGGFTTAIGDGNRYGTNSWGANLLAGAGWTFSRRFALLGEYQFNSSKIPGRTLSAVYNSDPATYQQAGINRIGGNVHTSSITAEPVFYYYNSAKHNYAGYLIGGVGWYHKTINFTAPVVQSSFYYGTYVSNQTFSSYSDNGVGLNLGTGVAFKVFGPDSHAKLFAEARYIWANTPRETAAQAASTSNTLHTGTEELIPVTVGLRF